MVPVLLPPFVPTVLAGDDLPVAEVRSRWGDGVTVRSGEDTVQVQARVQVRASVLDPGAEGEPLEPAVSVRRMRLAHAPHPRRQESLKAPAGEPAARPRATGHGERSARAVARRVPHVVNRAGQMKVPFNRERVVSSGALQFVDRSVTNAALNLDRDVGVQIYSADLFGFGERLGYQLGLYNGDGRNRAASDAGLLYVARLDLRPLGAFPDVNAQADLHARMRAPRVDLGVAVARNEDTVRERSTTGATLAVPFTYDHGAVDLVAKAWGASLHAEGIVRRATEDTGTVEVDGVQVTDTSNSAWGWSVMGGYLLAGGWEPVLRVAVVTPIDGVVTAVEDETEVRVGLNWYVQGHDLKVQLDGARLGGSAHPDDDIEVRLQTQAYF